MAEESGAHTRKVRRQSVDAEQVRVKFSADARRVLNDALRTDPQGAPDVGGNLELMLEGKSMPLNIAMSEMVMLGGKFARMKNESLFRAQLQNMLGMSKFLAGHEDAPVVCLWASVDPPEKERG